MRIVTCVVLCSWILSFSPGAAARAASEAPLSPGDPLTRVIEILGEPKGRMGNDREEFLYYPRGIVVLRGGVVAKASLVPAQQAEAARLERERRVEERRKIIAELRRKRMEEGEARMLGKLADEAFQELPPEERLKFWQDFSREYPDVPVDEQLTAVGAELRATEEEQAQTDLQTAAARIAELEEQIEQKRNATGLSRNGLRKIRADLAALRKELATLRQPREDRLP